MANDVRIKITADDAASQKLDKVAAKGSRMGKALQGAFLGAGAAAGVFATQKLTQLASALSVDAVSAASDLSEALNKVNVVFGESADVVTAFAAQASDSIGQSERQALEAAGAFGNMFNTIGLAQSEAAKMSNVMVQLASDMGSFNNEDPSDMLLRLRSGLAGEAEPLRKFGVLLSAAAVQEEAVRIGLIGVGGALDEAQKVQARYSLILGQTTVQQGDFERTSEGLANATKALTAKFEELQAKLGVIVLPLIEDLVAALIVAADKSEHFFKVLDIGIEVWRKQSEAASATRGKFYEFIGAVVDATVSVSILVQPINDLSRKIFGLRGFVMDAADDVEHMTGVLGDMEGEMDIAAQAARNSADQIRDMAHSVSQLTSRALAARVAVEFVTQSFEDLTGGTLDWIQGQFQVLRQLISQETALADMTDRILLLDLSTQEYVATLGGAGGGGGGGLSDALSDVGDEIEDVVSDTNVLTSTFSNGAAALSNYIIAFGKLPNAIEAATEKTQALAVASNGLRASLAGLLGNQAATQAIASGEFGAVLGGEGAFGMGIGIGGTSGVTPYRALQLLMAQGATETQAAELINESFGNAAVINVQVSIGDEAVQDVVVKAVTNATNGGSLRVLTGNA